VLILFKSSFLGLFKFQFIADERNDFHHFVRLFPIHLSYVMSLIPNVWGKKRLNIQWQSYKIIIKPKISYDLILFMYIYVCRYFNTCKYYHCAIIACSIQYGLHAIMCGNVLYRFVAMVFKRTTKAHNDVFPCYATQDCTYMLLSINN
jgi:hypothetical protein